MDCCVLAHHWLIDALPTRGSYHARCKNCGQEREFPEDVTRFRFRMARNPNSRPAVELPSGPPAGASPPVPGGEEKTNG